MTDKFPANLQRPRLLALASALDVSLTQLRRDNCGDWAIIGHFGLIYALPAYFQIVISAVDGWKTQGWNRCKADLAFTSDREFCILAQDGDQDGAFFLGRDPDREEAEKIRKWVGLRKRMQFSAEALDVLRERGRTLAASRVA